MLCHILYTGFHTMFCSVRLHKGSITNAPLAEEPVTPNRNTGHGT